MGYEYRLCKMKKDEAERLSCLSYNDLVKELGEDDWFYAGHLPMQSLHSNGDLDADEVERIQAKGNRFLTHETLNGTEEQGILLLEKEGVTEWIDVYRNRVIHFLERLMNGIPDVFEDSLEDKRVRYVESLLNTWKSEPPYTVEGENLSNSTKYEYIVFELVYQCKQLQDDEVFIFCGH